MIQKCLSIGPTPSCHLGPCSWIKIAHPDKGGNGPCRQKGCGHNRGAGFLLRIGKIGEKDLKIGHPPDLSLDQGLMSGEARYRPTLGRPQGLSSSRKCIWGPTTAVDQIDIREPY